MDYETTKALASDASDICGIVEVAYPDDKHLHNLCRRVLTGLNEQLDDQDQSYPDCLIEAMKTQTARVD